MASSATLAILLVFVFAVAVQSALGDHQLSCEELPPDVCAFAMSSSGRRCVLERTPDEGAHRCQTSAVRGARGLAEGGWVETDACVRTCGVDRAALGLPVASATAEDDRRAFRALCSPACRDACPNVVDLYATVAAAEGMSLPALCEEQNKAAGSRRMMMGMAPLGAPMPAPVAAPRVAAAPAPCEE